MNIKAGIKGEYKWGDKKGKYIRSGNGLLCAKLTITGKVHRSLVSGVLAGDGVTNIVLATGL